VRCRQRRRTRRDHRRPRRLAAQSGRRQRRRRGAPPVPTTLNGDIPGLCRSSVHRSQPAPHCAAARKDVIGATYCAGAVSRDPGGDSLQHYDRCNRRVTARAGGGPHACARAFARPSRTHAAAATALYPPARRCRWAPPFRPPRRRSCRRRMHSASLLAADALWPGRFARLCVCLFVFWRIDRFVGRQLFCIACHSHLAVPTGPTLSAAVQHRLPAALRVRVRVHRRADVAAGENPRTGGGGGGSM
jgi:hypothetical protein